MKKYFLRTRQVAPLSRKILVVDRSKGKRYKRDIIGISWVIGRRGDAPDRTLENLYPEEYPIFEIATNPQAQRKEEISFRKMKKISKYAVRKTEEIEVFNCLEKTCSEKYRTVINDHGFTTDNFRLAFSVLNEHSMDVDKIIISPSQVPYLRSLEDVIFFKGIKKWWFGRQECIGELWGAKIYTSIRVKDGNIFLLPKAKYLGILNIVQDIKCRRCDNPGEISKGLIVSEKIGICIMNEYAISMIKFDQERIREETRERKIYSEKRFKERAEEKKLEEKEKENV